jgi:serine/threonine protein kinase
MPCRPARGARQKSQLPVGNGLDSGPGRKSNACWWIVLGARVNNYELVRLIGEGGMGAVYLARHTVIGRMVAIKVMRRELAGDPVLVNRFTNEAKATNAIGHPNIIDILDIGVLPDGVPFLVMEWLDGETVAARIERQKKLPIAEAVEFARQTAIAIGAANARGILHRDLKPENLLLARQPGGGEKVKVLDFGIAKLVDSHIGATVKTFGGRLVGTPVYMSPEQFRGVPEAVDQRSDVYALGVVLYQMVCGRPPFQAEGVGDLQMMHTNTPPPPPRRDRPDLPPELEAVILRCLAKRPADRFASMGDLAAALAAGSPRGPRRYRRWMMAGVAAAVACVGVVLIRPRPAPQPPPPRTAVAPRIMPALATQESRVREDAAASAPPPPAPATRPSHRRPAHLAPVPPSAWEPAPEPHRTARKW